jgi:2-dehydro-3-deoxyglucarate aldolase/4-hydroxy-2-oxoheptanedioate aldolase
MARLKAPELQRQLRASLQAGKSLGTFIGIPSTISYELAALAGFDWVISDLEHGENEFADLARAVVAFDGPVVARVSSPSAENISRALDRGVAGIMIPRISSFEDLDHALTALDYPPKGSRGVASYNRSASWGADQKALVEADPVAIVQVETRFAVNEIAELVKNKRVDALFIGPLDLSYSLGVPRDYSSEVFQSAIASVLENCRSAKKPLGILATSAQDAKAYEKQGFDFLALGSDSTSLLQAFKSQIEAIRNN